jgi:hypothetical protein
MSKWHRTRMRTLSAERDDWRTRAVKLTGDNHNLRIALCIFEEVIRKIGRGEECWQAELARDAMRRFMLGDP